MAHRADRHARKRPRAQHDAAAFADCLQRVAREVQERLHDLVAIEVRVGQARVVVAFEPHRCGRLAAHEGEDVVAQLVHVGAQLARQARGTGH